MYSKLPNLVIGFHGCKREICDRVLNGHDVLKESRNTYDWLGNGIYFWENNLERALQWANQRYGDEGTVLGAVVDLGFCLNLTDSSSIEILKQAYLSMSLQFESHNIALPVNARAKKSNDELLRWLDCAVIQQVHDLNSAMGQKPYDSVRGVFTEGKPIYKGAAILEKTHIQLCVRNPNCIKGYFLPVGKDAQYEIP